MIITNLLISHTVESRYFVMWIRLLWTSTAGDIFVGQRPGDYSNASMYIYYIYGHAYVCMRLSFGCSVFLFPQKVGYVVFIISKARCVTAFFTWAFFSNIAIGIVSNRFARPGPRYSGDKSNKTWTRSRIEEGSIFSSRGFKENRKFLGLFLFAGRKSGRPSDTCRRRGSVLRCRNLGHSSPYVPTFYFFI